MKVNYNRKHNKGLKEYKHDYIENRITADTVVWFLAVIIYVGLFVFELFAEKREYKGIWITEIIEIIIWCAAFLYYAFFSKTKPKLTGKIIITAFAGYPVFALLTQEKVTKLALLIVFIISFAYLTYNLLKKEKTSAGIKGVAIISTMLLVVGIYDFVFTDGYPKKFLCISVVITVAATAVIIALIVKGRIPENLAEKAYEKASLIILAVVFTLVLSYSACVHMNYIFDNKPTVSTQVTIKNKDIIHGARTVMRFVFYSDIDGREVEFDVDSEDYLHYEIGDTYVVKKCAGAFNEEYYH